MQGRSRFPGASDMLLCHDHSPMRLCPKLVGRGSPTSGACGITLAFDAAKCLWAMHREEYAQARRT